MKRIAATLPTNANNSGQRVVRIRTLLISVMVSKPTSGRNTPSATSAVSAVSRSASPKRVRILGPAACAAPISDLLDIRPAQQPLRQENQSDRQHGESSDILIVDGEVGRPQRFNQADEKAADNCAGQRTDTAQHGRGEGFH